MSKISVKKFNFAKSVGQFLNWSEENEYFANPIHKYRWTQSKSVKPWLSMFLDQHQIQHNFFLTIDGSVSFKKSSMISWNAEHKAVGPDWVKDPMEPDKGRARPLNRWTSKDELRGLQFPSICFQLKAFSFFDRSQEEKFFLSTTSDTLFLQAEI